MLNLDQDFAAGPENPQQFQRTIIISDANPILSKGMRQILRSDAYLSKFRILTTTAILDLAAVKALAPDILILDPFQSAVAWEALSKAYLSLSETVSLVAYCPQITPTEPLALSLLGFQGIVPRTIHGEDLVRVVSTVASGAAYLHESYHKNRTSSSSQPDVVSTMLTDREGEVLRHVALGSSMKEIAAVLKISTKTVDTYKTRASLKLNLHSRFDIVRYAIQSGWMN